MKNKPAKGENNTVILLTAVCAVIVCAIILLILNGTIFNKSVDKDVSVVRDEAEEVTEAETEATTEEEVDIFVEPVELNDELYGYINTLNTNLRSYFDENYDSGNIITVYGYMYDAETNMPVKTEDVYGEDVPDVLEDVNLLYIKSGDFDYIDGIDDMDIDIDITDEELSPFTSILTTEGYLISSDVYGGGILSEEDYRTLIMRYNCDHGEIYTPEVDSATYTTIYHIIEKEWGSDYTPDIKYMGFDDKYGVAVANVLESPTEFKEYLFIKSGSSWSIKSKLLANNENIKQFVNEKCPDMDLALLPYYNLAEYDDFTSDLYGYYEDIVSFEELDISENDLPAVYCLYSDNFLYYEFAEGKKVLGYVDDENTLTFYKVDSTDEAIAFMSSMTDNPPVFIIKFS